MSYYYNPNDFDQNKNSHDLQDNVSDKIVEDIRKKIEDEFQQYTQPCWVHRATFGFVFTDFTFTHSRKEKNPIGRGQSHLFEKLKKYYCVLLSKENLPRNFEPFKIDGKDCIYLNITYFKKFRDVITDPVKTAELFLYDYKSKEYAEFIKRWITGSGEVKEVPVPVKTADFDEIEKIFQENQIKSPEDLEQRLRLSKISKKSIEYDNAYFESRLEKFKNKYENGVDEREIQDDIFKDIWILDFKFMDYMKEKEHPTSIGNIDIFLKKREWDEKTNKMCVVEFKNPKKRLTSEKDRKDKAAILSEVGRALSQTMHYIENLSTDPYTDVEGLVVVGRKINEIDEFLTTFNKYLHGIKVVSFDDLYKKQKTILTALKNSNQIQKDQKEQ